MLRNLVFTILLTLILQNLFSQEYYQQFKKDFLEPFQKVASTTETKDDLEFLKNTTNDLAKINPKKLRQFACQKIYDHYINHKDLRDEYLLICLDHLKHLPDYDHGKLEMLKELEKQCNRLLNELSFKEKSLLIEVAKIRFFITQSMLEHYMAHADHDALKGKVTRWEDYSDDVRDGKILKKFNNDVLYYKNQSNNLRKIATPISFFRSNPQNTSALKQIAMFYLFNFNSPNTSVFLFNQLKDAETAKIISPYVHLLYEGQKYTEKEIFLSPSDFNLPIELLCFKLEFFPKFNDTLNHIREKIKENNAFYIEALYDGINTINHSVPSKDLWKDSELSEFYEWSQKEIKSESNETQLYFYQTFQDALAKRMKENKDHENNKNLVKLLNLLEEKNLDLQVKLKLTHKFNQEVPKKNHPKVDEWRAFPAEKQAQIMEQIRQRIVVINNAGNVRMRFDPKSLRVRIESNEEIRDLSPLAALPLLHLELSHNRSLQDIHFTRDMPLEYLNISWTPVDNISHLKNKDTLRVLHLTGTKIRHIIDLSGIPLEELGIGHNRINNITPLKGMPLRSLHIYHTDVSDLSPLEGAPLEYLNADRAKIKDLSPLEITKLRYLNVNDNNEIRDLRPLAKLFLTELHIENTNIADLKPLSKMMLNRLYFNRSPKIKSLIPLKWMEIKHLGLNYTAHLASVYKYYFPVERLSLAHSDLRDLSVLKSFENINELDASNCVGLRDLRPLKILPFKQLNVSNCPNLKTLRGINESQVVELDVSHSDIKDLQGIEGSKLLKINARHSNFLNMSGIKSSTVKEIDIRWNNKLTDISDVAESNLEVLLLKGTSPKDYDPIRKIPNLKYCDQ